ncbi:MAG: TspO/MBR family protein [Devosia sp.]
MTAVAGDLRSARSLLILAAFILVVVGVGAVIGISTPPDAWYASLAKPPFNPPNWIFGPVWFTLYVLIAIAGWRTALTDSFGTATFLWILQMVLNWAWSPTWFGLHLLWPAFVIITVILALIIAFMVVTWRKVDRVSSLLFVPYALWVGFASTLNLSIAVLNS